MACKACQADTCQKPSYDEIQRNAVLRNCCDCGRPGYATAGFGPRCKACRDAWLDRVREAK